MKLGKLLPVLFFLIFLSILGIGYIYFFIFSPSFIERPEIEKPLLVDNISVSENQIYYFMMKIDAYKLHNNPLNNEPPVIAFKINNEESLVSIENNDFRFVNNLNPDIRIFLSEDTFFEVIQSENFEDILLKKYDQGELEIEIVSSESTLALKGYKSIYDKIASENEITGNIVNLNPDNFTNGINISFLLFIALIMELIMRKL